MINTDELRAALEWYYSHFCPPEIEALRVGYVTGLFPRKRFWFVDEAVLCHAGNAYTLKADEGGRVVNLPAVQLNVQAGDVVAYSPYQAEAGTRAYRWILVNNLLDVYRQSLVKI